PLLQWLRDDGKLIGVAQFREYIMDWPERLCLDAVMDARRMGAVARNYTRAKLGEIGADGQRELFLTDQIDGSACKVRAGLVLNMTGIWIDEVVQEANGGSRRYITGTKGTHIMVQLPEECGRQGIAALNRLHEPHYLVPWRGMHLIG